MGFFTVQSKPDRVNFFAKETTSDVAALAGIAPRRLPRTIAVAATKTRSFIAFPR
jgi:hypothetical protein